MHRLTRSMCPWPSGPGVGLPNRTGGFDSRRALWILSGERGLPKGPGTIGAKHPSGSSGQWCRTLLAAALHALADQPEWSPRSQRGDRGFESHPGYLKERVGWAWASPGGCNPPALAVQVRLLPDTPGQVVEWQTRQAQNLVPTRREGSSPSLVTDCLGGETEIMAPSEGAGPGSIPGRGAEKCRSNEANRPVERLMTDVPGVWRKHAALRRRRSCRFDSCRGYCGRTQSGCGARL